jgi:tRNA threonylcarbamoyladenosine biosynthesis protein TsaE
MESGPKNLTLESLAAEAARFVQSLSRGDQATVVALHGDLGAGKTTFSQAIARSLGVIETVTSPTFVIQKIYDLTDEVFERLIHIDAYRLESGRDLLVLGWEAIVHDPGNLIVVEWAERVSDILPASTHHLTFAFADAQTRTLMYGSA